MAFQRRTLGTATQAQVAAGTQGEGKAGNNKLPPVPDPQVTVYATFFHKLTPKLALGLQFAFQPTLPTPLFAVCPVLLEPSARSSPSSCTFSSIQKNLCYKVVETDSLWQAKNDLENQHTSYAVLYRLKGKNGSWNIYIKINIYIFNGKINEGFGIKNNFTNSIYLTKATIYWSTKSCHCRSVSGSPLLQDQEKCREVFSYSISRQK